MYMHYITKNLLCVPSARVHGALGIQIANPDGRGKGTNKRMHGMLPLSFRTHRTLPLSLRTYRMSTHTFITDSTYHQRSGDILNALSDPPRLLLHCTAYMHFHGILYSPLTTGCYVQFSALRPPPSKYPKI